MIYEQGKQYIVCLERNDYASDYFYIVEYQYKNDFTIIKEASYGSVFAQKRYNTPKMTFADKFIVAEYNGEYSNQIRDKYPEHFI